jgi:hypothetical protein
MAAVRALASRARQKSSRLHRHPALIPGNVVGVGDAELFHCEE